MPYRVHLRSNAARTRLLGDQGVAESFPGRQANSYSIMTVVGIGLVSKVALNRRRRRPEDDEEDQRIIDACFAKTKSADDEPRPHVLRRWPHLETAANAAREHRPAERDVGHAAPPAAGHWAVNPSGHSAAGHVLPDQE